MVGALAMLPRGRHTLGARPEVPVSEFVASVSCHVHMMHPHAHDTLMIEFRRLLGIVVGGA